MNVLFGAQQVTPVMDFAVAVMRVTIGVTLALHGYGKFFRGGRIPGTAGWFDSIGMKPGRFHALTAACSELGAGSLMALGLATPLAAAGFVGLMTVAAYTVHRGNFFIVANGWEYNMVLAVVATCIAGIGPLRYSLDAVLGIDQQLDGWVGIGIGAGAGLAGAIGLLTIFYREPAE